MPISLIKNSYFDQSGGETSRWWKELNPCIADKHKEKILKGKMINFCNLKKIFLILIKNFVPNVPAKGRYAVKCHRIFLRTWPFFSMNLIF